MDRSQIVAGIMGHGESHYSVASLLDTRQADES